MGSEAGGSGGWVGELGCEVEDGEVYAGGDIGDDWGGVAGE